MKKFALLVCLITGFFAGTVLADSLPVPPAPEQPAAAVDAGNKLCPVSGDPVSPGVFVEHNGVRYGLCCAMCANQFKKDPEKYLAQLAAQEASGEAAPSDPGSMAM